MYKKILNHIELIQNISKVKFFNKEHLASVNVPLFTELEALFFHLHEFINVACHDSDIPLRSDPNWLNTKSTLNFVNAFKTGVTYYGHIDHPQAILYEITRFFNNSELISKGFFLNYVAILNSLYRVQINKIINQISI